MADPRLREHLGGLLDQTETEAKIAWGEKVPQVEIQAQFRRAGG
jgi:hypothetical protein